MKIKISKSQWKNIGKKAGWIKTSIMVTHDMYVSFVDDLLFENEKDIRFNIKEGINPENIWIISYNNTAINDERLFNELWDRYEKGEYGIRTGDNINFYKQIFEACSIKAVNYKTNAPKDSKGLIDMINQTSDLDKFFEFIKENQEIYKGEAMAEEEAMQERGEMIGDYEKYGPDQPRPQY